MENQNCHFFVIDIDFDILSFHLAFHCSEYNGYHIFVWIYGVSHGGYVYAFKMYIFEKVRARNFARAWGFAQMAMGIPTLVGIPAASEFFLVQAGFASESEIILDSVLATTFC